MLKVFGDQEDFFQTQRLRLLLFRLLGKQVLLLILNRTKKISTIKTNVDVGFFS